MPENGYVAVCIRPDCEWIAVGQDGKLVVSDQLGALALVDRHCHDVHGEPWRTARIIPAAFAPNPAAVAAG